MKAVLLTYYNDDEYIDAQIESIFKQSNLVDKIIIANDCSEDYFKKHIQKFESKAVKIIDNAYSKGTRATVFDSIKTIDADTIFLADQDDVWMEEKVERIAHFFDTNPDIDVVCSNAIPMGGDSWMGRKTVWDIQGFMQNNFASKKDVFQYLMLFGNFSPGATMALRKSALSYLLPYDYSTNYWHDEWFIFLAAAKGKLGLIAEPLMQYRVHQGQQVGLGTYSDFQERMMRNEEVLSKRINEDNANGLLGIYWSAYKRAVYFEQKSSSSLQMSRNLLEEFNELKYTYLRQMPFWKQRYFICRWWFAHLYDVSFWDMFKLL